MTVLVNSETRVVVQGITGREGSFHTRAMLSYGTKILAGVTPGKGGATVEGVPVYDNVMEAVRKHPELNTSIIFVPSRFASDAVYEAIDAGLDLIVVITEGIPVHETMKFVRYAKINGVTIIGPNCPGVISPGESKVGIMPGHVFSKGRVGIVSRSGTLTYEIAYAMTKAGIGQSTCIGIGGDPVPGTSFIDALEMFREDDGTDAVVLIGEIGGDMEERAARYIVEQGYEKPVVAYVAGRTAPPGKRMGHAGAIISMGVGDAASKIKVLREVGVEVAELPSQIPSLLMKVLKK
ncbi:MAG: succinate--CoA ligase subunit alpha [Thaumarchaeota archaeon]|jgi:succinyl-CoA synthetase alpha subunit|nr:succinate--CoA ligase subunit alpha [Candidatus Geocrenenecus arthurdayi]MCL7396958.1 succinate--CoA ligase subunit alpha [Candidatus Geocrenenecus arthurdayi]MCL7402398.1 succinate--CoA ligase subunit alpha [Candidatus Geocrenenecus arthurdayi]